MKYNQVMKGVTSYTGISKFYFLYLLRQIIKIGELSQKECRILDFGCGEGKLKSILGNQVINYDVIEELSDTDNWKKENFDVIVANQVFYSFDSMSLSRLLKEFKKIDKKITLIVGISRQGILNKIGKYILARKDAHNLTKLSPKKEFEIINNHAVLMEKRNILFLTDIYKFQIN